MTDLARRVAPPDRNQMASQEHHLGIPMLLALAVGVATYFTLGLLWAGLASVVVLFTAGIIGAIRAAPEVDRRYAAAFKAWNEKFLCMQCGAVMKVKFCDGVPRIEPVEENLNIDNLIRVGQTIQAIKLLREQTGLGLAEAKARVDARAVELRQS